MSNEVLKEWFHGSPVELTILKTGSSITPFSEIAKAYSHKPKHLELSVLEDTENGLIHVEVIHDGTKPGFIYQVMITDNNEIKKPEENLGPLGEEMVTTQDVTLRFIGETEVKHTYVFDLKETRAEPLNAAELCQGSEKLSQSADSDC